jgi:hypothetical protein
MKIVTCAERERLPRSRSLGDRDRAGGVRSLVTARAQGTDCGHRMIYIIHLIAPQAGVSLNAKSLFRDSSSGPPIFTMSQDRTMQSLLRRAFELWPYLFVAVSVTGLAYIAITATR